jgi:hypothetical protein
MPSASSRRYRQLTMAVLAGTESIRFGSPTSQNTEALVRTGMGWRTTPILTVVGRHPRSNRGGRPVAGRIGLSVADRHFRRGRHAFGWGELDGGALRRADVDIPAHRQVAQRQHVHCIRAERQIRTSGSPSRICEHVDCRVGHSDARAGHRTSCVAQDARRDMSLAAACHHWLGGGIRGCRLRQRHACLRADEEVAMIDDGIVGERQRDGATAER